MASTANCECLPGRVVFWGVPILPPFQLMFLWFAPSAQLDFRGPSLVCRSVGANFGWPVWWLSTSGPVVGYNENMLKYMVNIYIYIIHIYIYIIHISLFSWEQLEYSSNYCIIIIITGIWEWNIVGKSKYNHLWKMILLSLFVGFWILGVSMNYQWLSTISTTIWGTMMAYQSSSMSDAECKCIFRSIDLRATDLRSETRNILPAAHIPSQGCLA